MENENLTTGKEINLEYLFKVFKKFWLFVIIAALVFAIGGALYSVLLTKPVYQGTASFYVNNVPANQAYVSQAQTSAAISIALSCVEMADQDVIVRDAVRNYHLAEALGYPDTEEGINRCVLEVRRMISAKKAESNTVIFYITVSSTNMERAYKVIQAMQSEFPNCVSTVMGMNQFSDTPMLRVVGQVNSELDIKVVKESPVKTAMMGAVLGATLSYAVFFCIKLKQDSKKRNDG